MNLSKCLIGEGDDAILILCGDRNSIQEMHTSAYNWGAIEENNHLCEMGVHLWGFAVKMEHALRWRADVASLEFDVGNPIRFDENGVEKPILKPWLMKRAHKWMDSLPDIGIQSDSKFNATRILKQSYALWTKNGAY